MRLWLPTAPTGTVNMHGDEDRPADQPHRCTPPGHQSMHSTRQPRWHRSHMPSVHRSCPQEPPCCARLAYTRASLRPPGNAPTKRCKPPWPQICPNPAKPNGSKPSWPVHTTSPHPSARIAWAHQRHLLAVSPDDGQPITIASRLAAAKSYTNPVSRSRCRIHIRKLHPSRYIGSRFGDFFCLSHQR